MHTGLVRLAIIAGMVFLFAFSAGAAAFTVGDTDLTLGGTIRLDSGWRYSDFGDAELGSAAIDHQTHFFTEHPTNSRVFVKAVQGKMSSHVEVGIVNNVDVETRHVYAAYDMGGGRSLLFGQTWVPFSEDYPNQRLFYDNDMAAFGDITIFRRPQIRFELVQDKTTFKLAFLESEKGFADGAHYDTQDVLPALVASVAYNKDTWSINPSLYAQQYQLKALSDTGQYSRDATVTTAIFALNASLSVDPITLTAELWIGQNAAVAATPVDLGRNASFGMPVFDGGAQGQVLEDVDSYGGWIQISAPIKTGTLYAGVGYQGAEVQPDADGYEEGVHTWAVFINYAFPLYRSFTLTPEIFYADYGNNPDQNAYGQGRNSLGTDLFIGIHFQYDF